MYTDSALRLVRSTGEFLLHSFTDSLYFFLSLHIPFLCDVALTFLFLCLSFSLLLYIYICFVYIRFVMYLAL